MHSTTILSAFVALFLAPTASAHMIMKSPVPFSVDKLDKSPLASFEEYPCKQTLGFNVSTQNTMTVGEEQTLSFTGSAVHGGGSCQLAISTDKVPTRQSKFKVIMSIEGGCPGRDSGPAEFKFTLPKETPNGDITFAWTWFAKFSGLPEMYMNCAPVTVSNGADDVSGYEALPDIFIANVNGCKSPISGVVAIPNASNNGAVYQNDTLPGESYFPPTGDCAQGAAAPPPGGTSEAPVPGATSPAGGNNGQPTPNYPAAPDNTGVVLAPGACSGSPAEPPATLTTLVTVTGSSPGQTSVAIPPVATPPTVPTGTPIAPANPPVVPSSPPTPSPPTDGGAAGCTSGTVVCNGPDQVGLCAHGKVVFGPVAAGTTCSNGAITRREKRFSRAHKRHFHGLQHRY